MADAPETTAAAPAPAGGSKIVPALVGVNSVLVAVLIAMQLMHRGGGAGAAAPSHDAKGAPAAAEKGAPGGAALPGPTQRLADFVVHLRDPDADRFARVSFEVEVGTEEDKAKLNAFTPRIRDAFIAYLSDRTLEEMRGSEAIRRTKSALEAQLPELAPTVKVRALYVTDLVIQ